jgi:two-component system sensor histidine kinase KdpD
MAALMRISDQLSIIAHDLRAPLTVIAGTAGALRPEAPSSTRAALDKIVTEAQRLGRMLENRVVAARLADNVSFERQWMPMEDVLGSALARLDSTLGERRVELAIAADAIAHVEPHLAELLVMNLVDNAARYSTAASIWIAARRVGDFVAIDVEDAGDGIPDHVAMGATELARGKGLAVCRAITEAHRGSFEVTRRDAGGTRVHVTIPDAEPHKLVNDHGVP